MKKIILAVCFLFPVISTASENRAFTSQTIYNLSLLNDFNPTFGKVKIIDTETKDHDGRVIYKAKIFIDNAGCPEDIEISPEGNIGLTKLKRNGSVLDGVIYGEKGQLNLDVNCNLLSWKNKFGSGEYTFYKNGFINEVFSNGVKFIKYFYGKDGRFDSYNMYMPDGSVMSKSKAFYDNYKEKPFDYKIATGLDGKIFRVAISQCRYDEHGNSTKCETDIYSDGNMVKPSSRQVTEINLTYY